MYLSFFNLRREPFGITPDPRFFYLSSDHKEALAAVVYGVTQRKGFISIVGEVGTGKTMILRAFMEGIDPKKVKAIYILNPLVSFPRILDEILPTGVDRPRRDRLTVLQEWLIDEYRGGRNVVLVIDEAQRMPPDTLEKLRLLSNLETGEHKLLQIVLAGQPELDAKLNQHTLRQLKQRIAVRANIGPLTEPESRGYIHHRLSRVLTIKQRVFTRAALNRIVRHARGNPRTLNILCDNALVAAYGDGTKPVTARIVREVIADYSGRTKRRLLAWKYSLSFTAILAVGLIVAAQISSGPLRDFAMFGGIDSSEPRSELSAASFKPQTAISESIQVAEQTPDVSIELGTEADQASSLTAPESKKQHETPGELSFYSDTAQTVPAVDQTVQSAVEAPDATFPITVVIKRGDGLWELCRSIYGFTNAGLVGQVIASNPQLGDPNALSVGDTLIFPEVHPSNYDAVLRTAGAVDD